MAKVEAICLLLLFILVVVFLVEQLIGPAAIALLNVARDRIKEYFHTRREDNNR